MQHDIQQYLSELYTVQEHTLSVLSQKQKILVKPDRDALAAIAAEEQEVLAQLRQCVVRREEILAAARKEGHEVKSIQSLCERILSPDSECLRLVEEATRRSRLIQLQSRTNCVVVQKSLNHLSQLLDIIATRGHGSPTYHRHGDKETGSSGGFVDRVA